MQNQNFEQILFALLRRSTPDLLSDIIETAEGLENRIYTAAHQTHTLMICAAPSNPNAIPTPAYSVC